ncbi:phage tail sheath C-terminal domain-containing protein [Maridesulfovibrio sp.]|uniref:phage tail sheath C-terminal domain-containing protein n=1 Tax=Maridesulfovibrio sp. TaxID=2795000 RepID=UPI0039EFA82F
MATYKTPDVYVEEISLFPPSVAEVATAVPAFIGYTERGDYRGENLINHPVKITSIMEYHERFGGRADAGIKSIELDESNVPLSVERENSFCLYDSLLSFFSNGGGSCYIVSIGTYATSPEKDHFLAGFREVAKEDSVTLLVFPDAIHLEDALYSVQQAALEQCAGLKNRFAILDIKESVQDADGKLKHSWEDGITQFRNKIGINNLKYGAAYTPHIIADLGKKISYRDVKNVLIKGNKPVKFSDLDSRPLVSQIIVNLDKSLDDITQVVSTGAVISKFLSGKDSVAKTLREGFLKSVDPGLFAANDNPDLARCEAGIVFLSECITEVLCVWGTKHSDKGHELSSEMSQYVRDKVNAYLGALTSRLDEGVFSSDQKEKMFKSKDTKDFQNAVKEMFDAIKKSYTGMDNNKAQSEFVNLASSFDSLLDTFRQIRRAAYKNYESQDKILKEQCPIYNSIVGKVRNFLQTIPPSGAMAGVYASVDRSRGVWKAPANVSLNSVLGITKHISNLEQEDLNIDVTAGKSVNAIRPFQGKGILVWGARTLMGNDNEWRYISVRRFFNMVETSVKLSTYWAVFEPNTANLWVKVKAMIENYLAEKWKEGALAGATPDQAFYVNVGLGSTMTAVDILEGRLIIDIGMAVVRPAEFIVLRFAHKMQES